MLRLFRFLAPHKILLIQLSLVNVLLSAMLAVAPLVIKAIVDDVISAQQFQYLMPYLGLLLGVTVVRVTSTYFSPTLGRGIAMGLVKHGPQRMGEVIGFPTAGGGEVKAKIVGPVFYDPEGAKQNV